MRLKKIVAPLVGIALIGSACGGSGGSDDDALIEALAANWAEEDEFPETIDIDCAAAGFVEGLGGAEGAAGYGVTVANAGDSDFDDNPISEEHARAASANMFKCDGFKKALLSEMGSDLTDDQANCLDENVNGDALETLIASTFMGEAGLALEQELENTFEEDFFGAFVDCEIDF